MAGKSATIKSCFARGVAEGSSSIGFTNCPSCSFQPLAASACACSVQPLTKSPQNDSSIPQWTSVTSPLSSTATYRWSFGSMPQCFVTFSCNNSAGIVGTLLGETRGAVVCGSQISEHTIELASGKEYQLIISCGSSELCGWLITVTGADFGGGQPHRHQVGGHLSSGDATSISLKPH